MQLKNEIQSLFRALIGQRAWGAKVGWGSFLTIEFGPRHLRHRHYHGDWHLWLYQCDWTLNSETHEMANSESRKGLMQRAVDSLNDRELMEVSFDQRQMATQLTFTRNLRLRCHPYPDAQSDEECWMLFMPDKKVASLVDQGLVYEAASDINNRRTISRQ